ncbi:MAG: hypothetical protein ACRDIV_16765 [Ktedonobacteraceae bacterium]
MKLPQYNFGIKSFVQLIQQWFDTAFATADKNVRADLNGTWMMLAEVVYGSPKSSGFSRIGAEILDLADEGRDGTPPIHSIEKRLHELVNMELHEGFLVVALRDALEDLIARNHPSFLNQWIELADQLVPRQMRFSHRGSDSSPGPTVYSPK